jgi:hypothetical protein
MVRRVKIQSIYSYIYLFRFDGFTFFVYVSVGPVSKNAEIEELIKEMKEYRDGMVARNLPFQWISDIITKWEMKHVKTVSEESQDELEPINEKETFHPRAIDGYSE